MLEGYQFRQEQKENILAYFVAGLMNLEGKSLKHNITPMDLLKPLRPGIKTVNKKSDEEYLREKFGLTGGEK